VEFMEVGSKSGGGSVRKGRWWEEGREVGKGALTRPSAATSSLTNREYAGEAPDYPQDHARRDQPGFAACTKQGGSHVVTFLALYFCRSRHPATRIRRSIRVDCVNPFHRVSERAVCSIR